jgi:putative ABC transport system ATP-binding protein
MKLFSDINKQKGITILQVTHSHKCASYGDRIIELVNGRTDMQSEENAEAPVQETVAVQ